MDTLAVASRHKQAFDERSWRTTHVALPFSLHLDIRRWVAATYSTQALWVSGGLQLERLNLRVGSASWMSTSPSIGQHGSGSFHFSSSLENTRWVWHNLISYFWSGESERYFYRPYCHVDPRLNCFPELEGSSRRRSVPFRWQPCVRYVFQISNGAENRLIDCQFCIIHSTEQYLRSAATRTHHLLASCWTSSCFNFTRKGCQIFAQDLQNVTSCWARNQNRTYRPPTLYVLGLIEWMHINIWNSCYFRWKDCRRDRQHTWNDRIWKETMSSAGAFPSRLAHVQLSNRWFDWPDGHGSPL